MKYGVALAGFCVMCMMAVSFSGCLGSNSEKPITPTPYPTTVQTPEEVGHNISAEGNVVDANNRFALNLYMNLRKDPQYSKSTLFFSPFSISSALAITYEGARGGTADEIQSVFFFPRDNDTRRQGFEQLYRDINQGNSGYILKTADALWAEETYPFLPAYMHTAQLYYNANATNLDFKNQPENSRLIINNWVENQTNDKIKDLIPPGVIDPFTRLVITNAVYFKGTWVKQFDPNETKDDTFLVAPGNTVHIQMMERTDKDAIFNYTETDSLQVLEMPYAKDSGKQISMLVLLPKANNLTAVEDTLTVLNLSEMRNALKSQRVNVFFPKFKLETKYSLSTTLTSMGMPTAFTDKADFSGMDGTKNLYIGDVIHQAFVEVNEEGTEAAAATGVVMEVMAVRQEPPVPVFDANHPFVFLIQDNDTGNILFMGQVLDPNG